MHEVWRGRNFGLTSTHIEARGLNGFIGTGIIAGDLGMVADDLDSPDWSSWVIESDAVQVALPQPYAAPQTPGACGSRGFGAPAGQQPGRASVAFQGPLDRSCLPFREFPNAQLGMGCRLQYDSSTINKRDM